VHSGNEGGRSERLSPRPAVWATLAKRGRENISEKKQHGGKEREDVRPTEGERDEGKQKKRPKTLDSSKRKQGKITNKGKAGNKWSPLRRGEPECTAERWGGHAAWKTERSGGIED